MDGRHPSRGVRRRVPRPDDLDVADRPAVGRALHLRGRLRLVLPLAGHDVHHPDPHEPRPRPDAPVPVRGDQPPGAALRLDERDPRARLRPVLRRERRRGGRLVPLSLGTALGRALRLSRLPRGQGGLLPTDRPHRGPDLPVPAGQHRLLDLRLRELPLVLHVRHPHRLVLVDTDGQDRRPEPVRRVVPRPEADLPRVAGVPAERADRGEMGGVHRRQPRRPCPRLAGVHVRGRGHRALGPRPDDRRADPARRLVRPVRLHVDRRARRLSDGDPVLPRPEPVRHLVRTAPPAVLRGARAPPTVPAAPGHPVGRLDPGPGRPGRRRRRGARGPEPGVLHERRHGAGLLRQEPHLLDRRGSAGAVDRPARRRLRRDHVLPRVRRARAVRLPAGPRPLPAGARGLPRLRGPIDLPSDLGGQVLPARVARVRAPPRRGAATGARRRRLPRAPPDGRLAVGPSEPVLGVPPRVQGPPRAHLRARRRADPAQHLALDRRRDPREHEVAVLRAGRVVPPVLAPAELVGRGGERLLRGRGDGARHPQPVR
jgi:hypothetical protein